MHPTGGVATAITESLEIRFLAAYDEHADALFGFCYAYLGDRERAKDAVQETFVRAWTYLIRGKRIDRYRPFLYRIARNHMIDLSRTHAPLSLEALADEGFDAADISADPMTAAEASRVVRLASRLEPGYRDAVLLRHVDGLSPRDIAALTGESENTVSVRIHRGLSKLRRIINPES